MESQVYAALGDNCRTYSTSETTKINLPAMDKDIRWSYKPKNGYLPFDLLTKSHLGEHNIPDENMKYIKMY